MHSLVKNMMNDKDRREENKAKLLEKVKNKEQTREKRVVSSSPSSNTSVTDLSVDELKKLLAKQKNENERLRQSKSEMQLEIQKYKQDSKKLKQSVYSLQADIKRLEESEQRNAATISVMSKTISSEDTQKLHIEEQLLRQKQEIIKSNADAYRWKKKSLALEKKLKRQRMALSSIATNQARTKTSKKKSKTINTGLLPEQIIYQVPLEQYTVLNLIRLLLQKQHLITEHEYQHIAYLREQISTRFKSDIEETLGYMHVGDDIVNFKDLNGKTYFLHESSEGMYCEEGQPARAHVSGDIANIKYLYETLNNTPKAPVRQIKDKEVTKKEIAVYKDFGDLDVLIVGINSKTHYVNRLQKHGCNVTWHNPIEESSHQLRAKAGRANIILILASHIKHSVTDILKRDMEGVHVLEKDNEEAVVARVYYALINGFTKGLS